jgi:hypothetical protein
MSILKILDEIGADTKRSHKIALLEQHKDNELLTTAINLALNPYMNFYIRKIPEYTTDVSDDLYMGLDWAFDELKRLSSRELTGHAGIAHLSTILSKLSADDAVVVTRIIGKDLRCGMADGIANAVIPDLVPTYPCLLARPYDAKNIKNIQFPALSQLKADGLRVNFHIDGDKVSICGRSGRAIDLLGFMEPEIAELGRQFDTPVVIDGELVVVDDQGKLLSRKVGNGIINKAIKGTIEANEAKMVRAQIWDVIPAEEFTAGASKLSYSDRFSQLSQAVAATAPAGIDALADKLKGKLATFWIIPTETANSIDEAVAHFERLLADGEEGTILKNMCGLWEDTRSKHLVKFKAEKTCDLEIIGFNPGTGKFEGMVGSLICASSDRLVEASISGFSDALRLDITQKIKELTGTIVEVMYNERISSKGKSTIDSLFLPRFNCFRDDKFVADSTNEIK